jgi:iron complex outermembrane recepter protein
VYSQRQAYFAEISPNPGVTPLPATANQHISPRIALRYSLSPALNWRASFSNAFKAPDWGELYSNYPLGGGAEFVGNPYLKAETVDSIETGLEWSPDASTRIYGTLYHNSTYGRIVATQIGANTYSNVNVGQADAAGYELSAQRSLGTHFSVRGSYANSPTRIVQGTGQSDVGNFVPQQPASVGSLALRYFNRGASAEFDVRSIGRAFFDEANTQPIDGTTLFDGSLAQRISDAGELYFEIQNIFNRQWLAEPTTYAPPRSVMFGFRRALQ